jgi:hypothetical protein
MPSHHLLKVVDAKGQLSLSPVVSVLNRAVLIHACKEAGDCLTKNDSLLRPGMLLGTEILVYMRHIQHFKRWLYLDNVLSFYGSHEGSGTVQAQNTNREAVLIKGYDIARLQAKSAPPQPRPRVLLAYSDYEPQDEQTEARIDMADRSWEFHFAQSDFIEVPYKSEGLPKIRDILDHACSMALPEDIVAYANADAGLTTLAYELIVAGVARGNGVTCCGERNMKPEPGIFYKDVTHCKSRGGIEVIAMTPQWWKLHREKMPDMLIGREAWDTVFATLAEEWADGHAIADIGNTDLWPASKAHTDNVCWHEEHFGNWQNNRMSEEGRYNRELARAFFTERGNTKALELIK